MATLNFPDAPSTGDTYTDSNSGFTYEWNGTVWISKDPSTVSNIREIDNISSGFDGSDTTFTLQVSGVNVEPANVQQLIISVGGVMQNAGQDFTLSGSTLTFTTAPTSGLTFFGVLLGTALSLNTVADGSVGTSSFEMPLTIGDGNDSTTIPGNAVVSGILTAGNAYVSGILTAKTLNYDNVTDIYSTGIITAKGGIQQTGNEGFNNSAGVGTFGSDVHLNGSQAGVTSVTWDASADSLIFQDLSYLKFGAGGDLSIYHDGSNTYIDESGTGQLTVRSSKTSIQKYTGEICGTFTADGSVELYEDNTKRFETASDDQGGGVIVTGKIVGTAATIGTGVTINNTGIDVGNAGIVTAGNVDAPDVLSIKTGTTEALKVDSSQRVKIGGVAVSQSRTVNIASNAEANLAIETHNDSTSEAAGIRFYKSGNTGASPQVVETDDSIAQLIAYGYDGTDYACAAASIKMQVDGAPGSNDMPGKIVLATTADGATSATERLRITSSGGFQFSNGLFDEKVNITAGKLNDNQDIDLADGMVHYFTTQEDTTATPNIRINSSISLQTAMDTGDVCTVTLITTAAAAGYSANLTIDGNAVTEEWVGGSAPSEGSADGLDIYTYTIICIGTGTGDSGFKVIANLTNATN